MAGRRCTVGFFPFSFAHREVKKKRGRREAAAGGERG
jgi:hypothetical protein